MAFGIFFIDAIDYIPAFAVLEYSFIALFILIACLIFAMTGLTYVNQKSLQELLNQPVRIFALGTWVAALSVFTVVLKQYGLVQQQFLAFIATGNTLLVSLLIFVYAYAFVQLFKQTTLKVDGIVLLSTVSIQSISIMYYYLFEKSTHALIPWLISLGLLCYLIGLYLIFRSYRKSNWTLADGWANTNCIIHGALSITGVASVLTGAFSPSVILVLLLVTTIFFIGIEIVECLRLFDRYKHYHLRDAIFNYHVTQWSRNFTFGMYFTFICSAKQKGVLAALPFASEAISLFLTIFAYVILLFLIIESLLFLHSKALLLTKRSFPKL